MNYRTIRHALIMAAGRGNRMRPLTDIIPKPMLPFKDDTLIGNSLSMLLKCVSFIHVTVGYKRAMLSQYLMEKGVDTIINTEGHNNAWWIANTLLRFLDEPVLVLTTDNVTELDIDFLTEEYNRALSPACMLVPVNPIPLIEGDYIDHQDGLVISIQREVSKEIYCSGIQVLNPSRVASIVGDADDFYLVWNALIVKKQLRVSKVYPKPWFSVDTLEQLANVTNNWSETSNNQAFSIPIGQA